MKIFAPWVIYYRKIETLFAHDPEVRVVYDDGESKEVKIFVNNGRKADALAQLLPAEKTFGNVTLKVSIIPANAEASTPELIKDAFYGNPALVDVMSIPSPFGTVVNYAVFEGKVVQYSADDMSDPYGNKTTLYQDLARDVFEGKADIFFCTEPMDDEAVDIEIE